MRGTTALGTAASLPVHGVSMRASELAGICDHIMHQQNYLPGRIIYPPTFVRLAACTNQSVGRLRGQGADVPLRWDGPDGPPTALLIPWGGCVWVRVSWDRCLGCVGFRYALDML